MGPYTKGITALVAAVIQLLANFGIDTPPNVLAIVNSVVPVVGTVLVYLLPNKATA